MNRSGSASAPAAAAARWWRGRMWKLEFVGPPVEREIVAIRKTGLIDDGAVEHAKLQLARKASHCGASENALCRDLDEPILSHRWSFFTILMPAGPFFADADRIHR